MGKVKLCRQSVRLILYLYENYLSRILPSLIQSSVSSPKALTFYSTYNFCFRVVPECTTRVLHSYPPETFVFPSCEHRYEKMDCSHKWFIDSMCTRINLERSECVLFLSRHFKKRDNLQELGSSTIFESNSIFSNLVDKEIPVKKANSLSSIDLVARNLLLLAHDPMENSDFVEEKITREDDNLKKDREFILPPNNKGKKDEDEQPLIWKVRKLKDNKGKEKFIGSNIMLDPKIYEKPRMVEQVEYVRHQRWMHLFEEATPVVFENKVREFLYSIDFSDDGLSLSSQMQGKDIRLDEENLGEIMDVPIIGVKTVVKQQPTTKFMIESSRIDGTSITAVKKEISKE
ncbi:hypothetical protein FXO38_02605 [Capsicum annuum]|nr:hypothetical protein FXO38_02605 [Capsicum annuum]